MTDVIQYTFWTRVAAIEERTRIIRGYKDSDGKAIIETMSQGWFVRYEGSHEALFFGFTKPEFNIGDEIEIIQRKRKHDIPSESPIE